MTTRVSIKVDENGGPMRNVLIGSTNGRQVNAALYRPGETAEVWLHGDLIAFAREATPQDLRDRELVPPHKDAMAS